MMNKKRSNPKAIFKSLLFIPLIVLMVQVFAKKEPLQAGSSPDKNVHGKYFELMPDQLKLLGFEHNATGLFYKNTRVNRKDKSILCLYFTEKEYSASMILKQGEKIPKILHPGEKTPGHTGTDKILRNLALTNYDFYPIVVANFKGNRTLDMSGTMKDPKQNLLPIQVNMAGLNIGQRVDTLVFWFNPTESLKHALAPVAKMDEYLIACPPDLSDKGK